MSTHRITAPGEPDIQVIESGDNLDFVRGQARVSLGLDEILHKSIRALIDSIRSEHKRRGSHIGSGIRGNLEKMLIEVKNREQAKFDSKVDDKIDRGSRD